jgi:hypothetical protein
MVREIMEIAKPTKSESKWAESESKAIEPDMMAPVNCIVRKNIDTKPTHNRSFNAFLLLSWS